MNSYRGRNMEKKKSSVLNVKEMHVFLGWKAFLWFGTRSMGWFVCGLLQLRFLGGEGVGRECCLFLFFFLKGNFPSTCIHEYVHLPSPFSFWLIYIPSLILLRPRSSKSIDVSSSPLVAASKNNPQAIRPTISSFPSTFLLLFFEKKKKKTGTRHFLATHGTRPTGFSNGRKYKWKKKSRYYVPIISYQVIDQTDKKRIFKLYSSAFPHLKAFLSWLMVCVCVRDARAPGCVQYLLHTHTHNNTWAIKACKELVPYDTRVSRIRQKRKKIGLNGIFFFGLVGGIFLRWI